MIPQLLGIVNVTPDSFSDGGRFPDAGAAVDHAERLLDEGAAAVDVGGESTRPGASPVPVEEELRRVIPVVSGIVRRRPAAVISVDTRHVAVAQAAIEAGATIVNDVTGLRDPAMTELVARSGAFVVIMHMRGEPATMMADTAYVDLIGEIAAHLRRQAEQAVEQGVQPDRILLDPGLGFAKDPLDNPRLVAAIPELRALGYPVLVGASRKGFIGRITGVARPEDRVFGSIGAALAAAEAGADWLRVHDVSATRQALLVYRACRTGEGCSPGS